jgi:sugar phosphate isomerase/epimerase
VDFVNLAADLGCRYISIALSPITANPHGYPAWSLRDDPRLRRDMIAAMRDRGVSISTGEGFFGRPDQPAAAAAGDMDLMCELGARRITVLSIDRDRNRAFDQCAGYAEMASARGLETNVEFVPDLPIGDLPTAVEFVRYTGDPNVRLVIDVMHLCRSGAGADEIRALDPALIGAIQICDVPLKSAYASYGEEARHHRLPPGQGELPLLDLLVALPAGPIVGIEVPMLELAQAGVGPFDRLSVCVEAARDLLEQSDAAR